MLGNLQYATGVFDPLLWALQLLGAVSFVAAVPVSAWNAKLIWSDDRSRARKFWSVLIVASTLVILYVALCFGLIAFTVNF